MSPQHPRAGLVGTHVPTRGRGDPGRSTLIDATVLHRFPAAPDDAAGASVAENTVLDLLAAGDAAIAEIAAYLKQPMAVVKVIAGELIASQRIAARNPISAEHDGTDTLERIIHGLKRL